MSEYLLYYLIDAFAMFVCLFVVVVLVGGFVGVFGGVFLLVFFWGVLFFFLVCLEFFFFI